MVSWNGMETELLLKLVQDREALYDVSNENYTNRDIVWALWTDIARQLNKTPFRHLLRSDVITPCFASFQTIRVQNLILIGQMVPEKFERYMKKERISATACRDKWTSLRCVYRRIINQQANSKTKRKIKWPWAHMMTFLIPHLKTVQPRYGPDVEIDDTDSVITINDYKSFTTNGNSFMTLNSFTEDFEMDETIVNSEDGVAEYLYYESGAESDPGDDKTTNKTSLKQIKLEKDSQIKSQSSSKTKYRADGEEEYIVPSHVCCHGGNVKNVRHCDQLARADADEMFFRSIVPDVKLLNQKDKAVFKLKVQQLLHDMIYSSKDEETTTCTK